MDEKQVKLMDAFLDEQTKKVVDKIMSSNDLMSASMEKLIYFETPMLSASASSAAASGVALAAGSPGLAVFLIPSLVLTSVVAIGGGAYYGYIIHVNKECYKKAVEHAGLEASHMIWKRYIKDEIQNQRITDITQSILFDRKHEAINSWFELRNLGFLSLEEQESQFIKNKKINLINEIKKYIKPEYLKSIHRKEDEIVLAEDITQFDIETSRFSNDLRIYCAANKTGEFANTKPGWHSPKWYTREDLKMQMKKCLVNGGTEKGFEEIRDKFYRTYRAITYLNAKEYKGSQEDSNKCEALKFKSTSLANELKEFISARVSSDRRVAFEKLFRTYRYLGGSCEFNPDNIFEMQFFDQYYSSDIFDKTNLIISALGGAVCGLSPAPFSLTAYTLTQTPSEQEESSRWWEERQKRVAENPIIAYR